MRGNSLGAPQIGAIALFLKQPAGTEHEAKRRSKKKQAHGANFQFTSLTKTGAI